MQWRPSTAFDVTESTELWALFERIFDATVSMEPLCRGDENVLRNSYVRRRRNEAEYIETLRSQLPESIRGTVLGSTEIELITFLLEQRQNRVLNVEGPRGVGKTTLLHFVEDVIQQARIRPRPALLMLDGRQLRSLESITAAQYLALIRDELVEPRTNFDLPIRPATQRLAAKLQKELDEGKVGQFFRGLVNDLPGKDARLVTIIFDNLDQLSSDAIRVAADLAKSIYYASGIGSVLCLRPGSRMNLMQTASARALFSWVIPVEPPAVDAWLDRLAVRMRNTAKSTHAPLGRFAATNLPITPERVLVVMQRMSDLIKRSNHRGQSLVDVLDGMCGGDIRLLSWLTRNLLSHRSIPEEYLLTGAGEPSFRPVTAILEGPRVMYRSRRGEGRTPIPNLLSYRTAAGGTDLLLYHRTLSLLDDFPVATTELLTWLTSLGHEAVDARGVISELATHGLIGMTDREHLSNGDIPEQVFLTRSGYYYRDQLLSDADYLLTVVTDVALQHSSIRRGATVHYSQKVTSLAEYARCVEEEERLLLTHIEACIGRRDSRMIVDRVARSGFLSHAVVRVLARLVERAQKGSLSRIQSAIEVLQDAVVDLRSWEGERDLKLRALRTTMTLRQPARELQAVVATTPGMRVEVRPEAFGDEVELHADVLGTENVQAAFVAYRTDAAGDTNGQATLANLVGMKDQRLHGKFPQRTTREEFTDARTQIQTVMIPSSTRRVGLLSVNVEDGRFALQLYVYSDGRPETEALGLGERVDTVCEWARGELAEISDIVTSGRSFGPAVRTVGVELCRRVCGSTGAEILASRYQLIDTLVIFTKHLDIPWEWLCIPPKRGEPDLPSIGQQWRVVRWPWDRIQGTALTLTAGFADGPVEKLGTIGIAPGGRPKWRIPIPTALPRFRTAAERHDALHIVAHWDSERNALDLGHRLSIRADSARTYAPIGPRHIIVSACDVATTEQSVNVAIAFSETAGCTAWAPLVKIRRDDALALDRDLAAYLQTPEQDGIDGFMRGNSAALPLLSLYARYGICAQ